MKIYITLLITYSWRMLCTFRSVLWNAAWLDHWKLKEIRLCLTVCMCTEDDEMVWAVIKLQSIQCNTILKCLWRSTTLDLISTNNMNGWHKRCWTRYKNKTTKLYKNFPNILRGLIDLTDWSCGGPKNLWRRQKMFILNSYALTFYTEY